MEVEFSDRVEEHDDAKQFLLELLRELIEDQPQETYERLLPDDRSELRDWLGSVARATVGHDSYEVDSLMGMALKSDTIFFPPDRFGSKTKKEKRRANRRKKKNARS